MSEGWDDEAWQRRYANTMRAAGIGFSALFVGGVLLLLIHDFGESWPAILEYVGWVLVFLGGPVGVVACSDIGEIQRERPAGRGRRGSTARQR